MDILFSPKSDLGKPFIYYQPIHTGVGDLVVGPIILPVSHVTTVGRVQGVKRFVEVGGSIQHEAIWSLGNIVLHHHIVSLVE